MIPPRQVALMILLANFVLLVSLADAHAPAPVVAASEPSPSPSIYEVHLAVDIPVIVVTGSVGLVRVFWRDELARKSCPCDPSGLNALDRGTVGNHNHAA